MCKTLNATSTCYLCKVHKTHASENVVGGYINMNIPALQEVSYCSIRFYCVAYFLYREVLETGFWRSISTGFAGIAKNKFLITDR